MKKGYIVSAILGGGFFAVPYLALNVPIWGAGLMAGAAFGAGMLIFGKDNKKEIDFAFSAENNYEILKHAKENTEKLRAITKQLESVELIRNVNDICDTSDKIIDTLSKKPEKLKQAHNFLNYYLPVTIKILERYDEIENQKLSSIESAKFMNSIQQMIIKIKTAFENQLSNLYQSDMIDTDAEIKVFESMLKMDGFMDEKDFEIKKGE
ncbi:MAG: 5-bromo-4-chloroindolyl phosphate hydrolysis family protein [Clostridia bacterium]|nr:5-bromo-4-chloroindolyl phosphate hydrolysis family protein [Clostridia bacterium]